MLFNLLNIKYKLDTPAEEGGVKLSWRLIVSALYKWRFSNSFNWKWVRDGPTIISWMYLVATIIWGDEKRFWNSVVDVLRPFTQSERTSPNEETQEKYARFQRPFYRRWTACFEFWRPKLVEFALKLQCVVTWLFQPLSASTGSSCHSVLLSSIMKVAVSKNFSLLEVSLVRAHFAL